MNKNPNIERAARVLCETANEYSPQYPLGTGDQMATRLDAAGLLLTPLHERALAAVEVYSDQVACFAGLSPLASELVAIGRESLALKEKAKGPVWVAEARPMDPLEWRVRNTRTDQSAYFYGAGRLRFTESQARRVAAALNEGDECDRMGKEAAK